MNSPRRPAILFLCTGNSCRSQMAEGWARSMHGDWLDSYSAGIEAHGLNPHAVRVMHEAGVDITSQQSQLVTELPDIDLDLVVTVCGHADEKCPTLPRAVRKVHVPFDDPPALAREARDEAEALDCYRRVRDEIRGYVEGLPALFSQR